MFLVFLCQDSAEKAMPGQSLLFMLWLLTIIISYLQEIENILLTPLALGMLGGKSLLMISVSYNQLI